MDAQMAGDLVAFAEPVTKWSTMVVDPSSLLRVLRRAIKIAATPPMGPVYVCLPKTCSTRRGRGGPADVDCRRRACCPTTRRSARPRRCSPAPGGRDRRRRRRGVLGAQDELTRVAELLGAEVWEADAGEVNSITRIRSTRG
jgi:benzoylformate decarboxylase